MVVGNKTNATQSEKPMSAKISFTEKFSFGLGDFASGLVFNVVTMFLVFYYTDFVGMNAGVIGTIILFSRIFDGITDVVMGVIVDRTKSKHGKARPWLLWMAGPFAVCAIILFSVPDSSNVIQVVYIIITYNLMNTIYTAINIPYGVINALATQDQYERSLLNIFRFTLSTISTVIISFAVLPLIQLFGGGQLGWTLTITILSILSIISFLICFRNTKERVKPAVQTEKNVPVLTAIKYLFQNKYWVMMLLLFLCAFTLVGLGGGLNVYYAKWILHDEAIIGPLTLAGAIPVLLGLLVIAPFIKRFGKRNTLIGGMAIGIIGGILIIFNPSSINLVLIGTAIKGLSNATALGTGFAMLADTIEYGEWKHGVRTEGLIYSAGSFGTKVGTGFGGALMGWLLSTSGYIGTATTQTDVTLNMIIFMFIYIPIIVGIIAIVILYFYKLDKEYPQIIADLEEMKTR